ncbi:sulfatase-like hydrolase/transferase [Kiritimatiellota bacterium B12222]|nr:sulfatase-like hydrolase/transferase [Kiritimatiellota bacterium B12222]
MHPSRSAIMTGRHPIRSETSSVPMPGAGLSGMAPWEYTIAELLSDAGYTTALFGKWHLGNTEGRLPNDQGFDEWWGIKNSWDESGYTAWPLFKELWHSRSHDLGRCKRSKINCSHASEPPGSPHCGREVLDPQNHRVH